MGSDAEVYIFDYGKYINEVVPALKGFLSSGHLSPWLRDLELRIEKYWGVPNYLCSSSIDLDRYCDYIEIDFSVGNQYRLLSGINWKQRSCKSTSCLLRDFCIFHNSLGREGVEYFNWLACAAVIDKTLSKSQFVGRSRRASWYQEEINLTSIPVKELLSALAYRGTVIGYLWKNSDGIYGWLSPIETQQLYEELTKIDLPIFEPSFEAMEEARREFNLQQSKGTRTETARLTFAKLSLSFVRTVAQIACEQGYGILWGNALPDFAIE